MKFAPLLWIAVLVIAAAGVYVYLDRTGADRDTAPEGALKIYSSDALGISFQYPSNYILKERNTGNAEREAYAITLMDKDDVANIPVGGEGPTAITVDFFQNNVDNLTPEQWIQNTQDSNYKLSPDGVLTPTTVGRVSALAYSWDGLYRGNSIVFGHKRNIVMLSVTMMTPDDQIVTDFAGVVASIQLE